MANKRISELTLRTPNTTDLMLIGDPTTGYSFKTTLSAILSNTVTSVALTMPSAFAVAGSPITSSGTFAVTAVGNSTQYIAGDGTLVTFPIAGQSGTLVREVRNETGATLTKGTVVYINGASGNKPTVAKAIATADATSAQTFGVVQNDISNNNNGYVVSYGDLIDLNTSAYAAGAQLYLSSTVAGGFTTTKQYAPAHLVYVGVVTRSHATQGRIEVRIQNGYEMDELHDVSAQSPNNNDILQFKSSTGLWTKTAGTTTNIAEGTNLYFTDARARGALSFAAGSGGYNSSTGVITIPTNNNQLTNGAGYITSSALMGYVPYSGASANVNLGANYLIAQRFQSTGGELISVLLKGRSSDNKSQLQFYDNSGGNLYGYIESAPSGVNGSLNIVSGNSSIQLTNTYVSTTSLLVNTTDNGSGAKLQVNGAATFSSSVTAGGSQGYILTNGSTWNLNTDANTFNISETNVATWFTINKTSGNARFDSNLLIGTTTDNGAKLNVNGIINTTATTYGSVSTLAGYVTFMVNGNTYALPYYNLP